MRSYVIAMSACTALLVGGTMQVDAQQEADLSVRQFELDSFQSVSQAIADACTKAYPALKATFDEAIVTFRRRASAVIDALLQTERFRHLAAAKVPRQMIENSAVNAEALRREAANVPEAQCRQAIRDMGMSDEQLRATFAEVLEATDRCRLTSSCTGP